MEDNKNTFEEDLKQSQALMKIFHEKIKQEKCLEEEHKESICYRLAEIMTAAKNIYTRITPRIIEKNDRESMLELLSDFRLHYLNLADLIGEFDDLFLSSIIQEEGALMPDAENEGENMDDDESEEQDDGYEIDRDSISNN